MRNCRKSFTLIELLVVIAIIGILAGILIVSMSNAINSANDAKRKLDISNLYSSILAQGTKQDYPDLAVDITEDSPTELKQFINNYLASIPTDPKGIHKYFYYGDGNNFAVGAVLEDNTCFVKQTSNIFDDSSCTKLKEGGIGLVRNFMVLGGGGTYNLLWTIPSSFNISDPSTSTALICLGKDKTDTNPPTDDELFSSGNLVAIINGTNAYRYYASNADYNYYCKAITYNNTVVTNPGTVGSAPNTSTGGFSESSGSDNYSSSTPSASSSTPSASPPSLAGNTNSGGSYSSNFTFSNQRNEDGTGNITLSWIPGNLSTHTIIRRGESTSVDPSIAPNTLYDGIEVYNKVNTLDSNDNPIDPNTLHTFTDSNLNGNKYYCYSAWSYDSISDTYSNGYVMACSGISPTDASNLSIYGTASAINLSWTKGSGDKTMIRRKINTSPESFTDGELVYEDTASSYIDDGSSTSTTLNKNTTYCYSVWSYTSTPGVLSKNTISGCSQLSNIGNPSNLTFPNIAYNSMVLSWDVADGATTYVVVSKQGSIPTSRTDGTQVYNNSSTSFMDNNLTADTEYCYAVWGYDGESYSETPVTGCETTIPLLGSINNPATSCKIILDSNQSQGNGNYYIDPNGGDSSDKFQAYCDMTADGGGWMLVTSSMIQNELSNLVTANKSTDANGGLIVVAQPTAADCTARYYRVLLKDVIPWTQIRADYEFYQGSACWGVFGNSGYGIDSNLISFALGVDTIRNQVGMGSTTDNFDGVTSRCDNATNVNFWHHRWYSGGGLFTRKAQVILRRNSMSSVAGLSTGIACSWNLSSGWAYKNIYIR